MRARTQHGGRRPSLAEVFDITLSHNTASDDGTELFNRHKLIASVCGAGSVIAAGILSAVVYRCLTHPFDTVIQHCLLEGQRSVSKGTAHLVRNKVCLPLLLPTPSRLVRGIGPSSVGLLVYEMVR